MFFLGLLVGVNLGMLVAVVAFVTILFLRVPIEKIINVTETKLKIAGPHPKGAIYEPMTEGDEERERIIKENRERGLETQVKELMSE